MVKRGLNSAIVESYPQCAESHPGCCDRKRRLPDIDAVLFDLDDTLVDRKGSYEIFYRSFYDRQDAVNETVSWPEAKDYFWTLSPDNATDPRQAFEAIQSRFPGVTGDPDSHYESYFKSIVANMKPLPGALELAESLNSNGVPWGVVTNGNHFQIEKVKVTGFEDITPFVIATELHGKSKPDAEPYHHALRLLELDPDASGTVLFVGDNPHTDIIGAQGVGMRTAWIHMGREYPSRMQAPDMTIDSVVDLRDVLSV